MKVLVTGANGLLGHNVVLELEKRLCEIQIIVRSTDKIYFDTDDIEIFKANFTDHHTLKQAAHGCDAIIHIAAVTATDLLHYEDYSKVNVDGAAQIIKVADELNISKLIFVSTANTVGFGTENIPADENAAIQYPFTESLYARSKAQAEKLFVQASLLPHRHVIIINPTFMIGAYDTKPSSGKLMLMGYKKWLMFIPKGGKNFVAVTDVAAAVCNALTSGNSGERYLASGINLSFKDFYILQKQIGKYRQCLIEVPDFILLAVGKIGDLIRKFGVKTEVCSMNLQQLLIREYYKNEKIKTGLLMAETQLRQAILESMSWFKKKGMMK